MPCGVGGVQRGRQEQSSSCFEVVGSWKLGLRLRGRLFLDWSRGRGEDLARYEV
jgi:hypothetical protein